MAPLRLRLRAMLALLVALAVAMPAVTASAQTPAAATPASVGVLSQIGGPLTSVAALGGEIYAAVGPRLLVFAAADPAHLVPIGQSALLPADAQRVVVARRIAFVSYAAVRIGAAPGVALLGVSDPANPTLLSTVALAGAGAVGPLAVADGILAIAFDSYGSPSGGSLRFYAVADPQQPSLVGTYSTGESAPTVLAMAGPLVLYANNTTLHVLDISRPAQPRLVGRYATPPAPPNTGRTISGL
ncbi:MAG: hypothetical protein ACR2JY_23590 [Chloroflexota bacterium]